MTAPVRFPGKLDVKRGTVDMTHGAGGSCVVDWLAGE